MENIFKLYKVMHLIISSLIVYLLSIHISFGQYKPGLNWKKINTSHYKILVPESNQAKGLKIANRLEYLYSSADYQLTGGHEKLPLILNPSQSTANGYVILPPYHSEWTLTPALGRFTGTNHWTNLLALHEIRHAVQYSFLNQGKIKTIDMLFGDLGRAGVSNLLIPRWYFEGDAIYQETILSNSGRGRIPFFNKRLKALLLNNMIYKYNKTIYGSYRNKVPSHYQYGYHQIAYLSTVYSRDTLRSVINETLCSSLKFDLNFMLHPFSTSLKKYTGHGAKSLYRTSLKNIKSKWKRELQNNSITDYHNLTSRKEDEYIDYYYPQLDSSGTLFCVRSGLSQRPTLCKITEETTKYLHPLPAECRQNGFDIENNLVVWSEFHNHKRWSKESWSDLVIYNLKIDERKRLTHKRNFFQPVLSPSGKNIAAISFDNQFKAQITILNSSTGKLLKNYKLPTYTTPMTIAWFPSGQKLVYILKKNNNKTLRVLNLKTGKHKKLIQGSSYNLYQPICWKNYILFESTFSGQEEIFAIDTTNKVIKQIVSSKIGAYNPEIDRNQNILYYNNYTHKGYNIVKTSLTPKKWTTIDTTKFVHPYSFQSNSDLATVNDSFPHKNYPIKNYHGVERYINLHSWLPLAVVNNGIFLFSDNILNTLNFKIGGYWNINESEPYFLTELMLKKFYPITSISYRYGIRKSYFPNSIETDFVKIWKESNLSISQRIPLISNKQGITQNNFSVNYGVSYLQSWNTKRKIFNENGTFTNFLDRRNGPIYSYNFGLRGGIIADNSYRDLVKDGIKYQFKFAKTLPFSPLEGQKYYFASQMGIRTPSNDGGFKLHLQYEKINKKDYKYSHSILRPSSISHINFNKAIKSRFEYKFPLYYPDLGILGFTYLKRISKAFFLEYFNSNKQAAFNIGNGLTFELGGFFGIKFSLPVTINFYYDLLNNYKGINLRLNFNDNYLSWD